MNLLMAMEVFGLQSHLVDPLVSAMQLPCPPAECDAEDLAYLENGDIAEFLTNAKHEDEENNTTALGGSREGQRQEVLQEVAEPLYDTCSSNNAINTAATCQN